MHLSFIFLRFSTIYSFYQCQRKSVICAVYHYIVRIVKEVRLLNVARLFISVCGIKFSKIVLVYRTFEHSEYLLCRLSVHFKYLIAHLLVYFLADHKEINSILNWFSRLHTKYIFQTILMEEA